jgi:hypothetical protein
MKLKHIALILAICIAPVLHGLNQPQVEASGQQVLATGSCTNANHAINLTDGNASAGCSGVDLSTFSGEWAEWYDSAKLKVAGYIGGASGAGQKVFTSSALSTQNWQTKAGSFNNNDSSGYVYRILSTNQLGRQVASGTVASADVKLATVNGGSMIDITGLSLSDITNEGWVKKLVPTAWWKADDLADANGTAIATWVDKMATYNATQATEGYRPKVIENCISTRKCLRFDGGDDFLQATMTITQPDTIFIVEKLTSIVGTHHFFDAPSTRQIIEASQFGLYSGVEIIGGAINTNANILTAYFNGTSSKLFSNGAIKVSGNTGTGSSVNPYIGKGSGVDLAINGDISEIIIFNRALNDSERQQVERYLSTYYGIALTGPNPVPTSFAGNDSGGPITIINPRSTSAATMTTNKYLLALYDSAGKVATGYVGAAGGGETLSGTELVTNGDMSSSTGWTLGASWSISGGLLNGIDGGGSGNAAGYTVTWPGGGIGIAHLYKWSVDVVSRTAGSVGFIFGQYTSPGWTVPSTYTGYTSAMEYAGNTYFNSAFYGFRGTLDNLSIQQVTDIATTGVRLHSSPNATNRNMARVETGFNPNAVTSYKLYRSY